MTRKLKPATLVTIHDIGEAIKLLKQARAILRDAGCQQTVHKLASAIKSAEGAERHAWRRHRAVTERSDNPHPQNDFDQRQAMREGWCVMTTSMGEVEIQKDDLRQAFDNDEAAQQFVRECADNGSAYHQHALRLLSDTP